jgi:uncharacterized protein (DUF1778 family)
MSKPKSEKKASKEPKPKREKPPKEPKPPQVVFAFRLAEVERDLIHKAAGPGKATRFVLEAALTAAKKALASQ